MQGSRKILCILLIFTTSVFIFFFLISRSDNDFTGQHYSLDSDEIVDSGDCSVPKMNPWDPTILKWIAHPNDLSCKQVQMNLTFIDYDGYLRYNQTALIQLKQKQTAFSCIYQTFKRCWGPDDGCISYSGKDAELTVPIKLSQDFVDVKCSFKNKTQFYQNIHAYPAKTTDRIFAKTTDDQLSVLLLIIDSTSYSVLQRNMPLTYNYTKNVMGIKYLEGKRFFCVMT